MDGWLYFLRRRTVSNDKNGPENDKDNPWYALARYMGLGLEVATAIVVCMLGGYKLDQKTGLSPLFLVAGLILGFAVVINILLHYSRAAERDTERGGKK